MQLSRRLLFLIVGFLVLGSGLLNLHFPGARFTFNKLVTLVTPACAALWLLVYTRRAQGWWRQTARNRTVQIWVVFLAYASLSLLWGSPDIAYFQNGLVYASFLLCILLGKYTADHNLLPVRYLHRLFSVLVLVVMCDVMAAVFFYQGEEQPNVVEERYVGMFALVVQAYFLAQFRSGNRESFKAALLMQLAIAVSLSRTSYAVSILLFLLAMLPSTWTRPAVLRASRHAALYLAGTALFLLLFIPLRLRYAIEYDIYSHMEEVTGIDLALNDPKMIDKMAAYGLIQDPNNPDVLTSGRNKFWRTAWASYETSPVVGNGMGSAAKLIRETYGRRIGQPHNDYLRLVHDFGPPGLLLFVLLLASLLGPPARVAAGLRGQAWQRTWLLYLVLVVTSHMLTDSVIIVHFMMAPLGLAIGFNLRAPQSAAPNALDWPPRAEADLAPRRQHSLQ